MPGRVGVFVNSGRDPGYWANARDALSVTGEPMTAASGGRPRNAKPSRRTSGTGPVRYGSWPCRHRPHI